MCDGLQCDLFGIKSEYRDQTKRSQRCFANEMVHEVPSFFKLSSTSVSLKYVFT